MKLMKLNSSHIPILKISNNRGFTLVELMITLVVSGIVMGAIYSAYVSQQRVATAQEQVVEMQQNVRAALDIIEQEIRMAGYDPRDSAGATITTATANNLIFTLVADTDGVNNDRDGATDEDDELETIEYQLFDSGSDGDMDLGRREHSLLPAPPLDRQAVAENIDAIEFYYTLKDGTQTLTPTAAELDDIRTVQISILARAGRPDPGFTNSMTYTPASGNAAWDINGATAGAGNPPNDNFRRRLLITSIQCRNMGL